MSRRSRKFDALIRARIIQPIVVDDALEDLSETVAGWRRVYSNSDDLSR